MPITLHRKCKNNFEQGYPFGGLTHLSENQKRTLCGAKIAKGTLADDYPAYDKDRAIPRITREYLWDDEESNRDLDLYTGTVCKRCAKALIAIVEKNHGNKNWENPDKPCCIQCAKEKEKHGHRIPISSSH